MAQKEKTLTYRVSELPSDVDEAGVVEILKECLGNGNDYMHIQVFSLAQSLTASTTAPTSQATVTIDPAPESLQNKQHLSITYKGSNFRIIIDRDFLGFTVLNKIDDNQILLKFVNESTGNQSTSLTRNSCVAISGLASHPFGSWQRRQDRHGTSFMWLRDELPKDLQRIRVITYGYDTQLDANSFQNIGDLATAFRNRLRAFGFESESAKPMVFLAHSLGGIILKQTLIHAMDSKSSVLLANTKACFCFGVPNRGMATDQLATLVDGNPTQNLVHDLALGSEDLLRIDRQFTKLQQARSLHVISFYETKTTKAVQQSCDGEWSRSGHEVIMVERESAIMGCSQDVHPINKDHSAMVKFEPKDEDYVIVRSHLQDVVRKLGREEATEVNAPSEPLFYSLCRNTHAITIFGHQVSSSMWDKTHSVGDLQISFRRTVRVHENNMSADLLHDLGAFPVYDAKRYPDYFRSHNGYFLPMHQREALWIKLSSESPYAIKIYVGGVNAISGEPREETEGTHVRRLLLGARNRPLQDYVVTPEQTAVYGIAHQEGCAQQFVAMPMGSGYSVEFQVTGEEIFGGLQIEVTPTYAPPAPPPDPWPLHIRTMAGKCHVLQVGPDTSIWEVKCNLQSLTGMPVVNQRLIYSMRQLQDGKTLSFYGIQKGSCLMLVMTLYGGYTPNEDDESMSVAVSGCIDQTVHPDLSRIGTWDGSRTTSVNIHILDSKVFKRVTGFDPPDPPLSARDYRELGFPYRERSIEAAGDINQIFAHVRAVNQIDKERLRTQVSEDAIRQLEVALEIQSSNQERGKFRHRKMLGGQVQRALKASALGEELESTAHRWLRKVFRR